MSEMVVSKKVGMPEKRALILVGGTWHDFDGFAAALQPVLAAAGWVADVTYDLEHLTSLHESRYAVVLSYTCFSRRADQPDHPGPYRMTDAQIAALAGWVRAGGGLLAAHAATVLGESNPALGELIGGVFVEHPPEHTFSVHPVYGIHPITAGVEAFNVHDELYIERCYPNVQIHLVAVEGGIAYPLAWSKKEGRGRVAHVALGHSAAVWRLEAYQKIMLAAMNWLTAESDN